MFVPPDGEGNLSQNSLHLTSTDTVLERDAKTRLQHQAVSGQSLVSQFKRVVSIRGESSQTSSGRTKCVCVRLTQQNHPLYLSLSLRYTHTRACAVDACQP